MATEPAYGRETACGAWIVINADDPQQRDAPLFAHHRQNRWPVGVLPADARDTILAARFPPVLQHVLRRVGAVLTILAQLDPARHALCQRVFDTTPQWRDVFWEPESRRAWGCGVHGVPRMSADARLVWNMLITARREARAVRQAR